MSLGIGSVDVGATGWLLTTTVLAAIMIPGVAFFYGGMVQRKNVLGTIMQTLGAIGVVCLAWMIIGFSLAFDEGSPYIGGLGFAGLNDPGDLTPGRAGQGVPLLAFAAFQMILAVFATVLITGAAAERWRFSSYLLFATLWSVLCYAPVAHWLFSRTGWASGRGAYDFAGGLVVHVNVGAAALAVALLLGRRTNWPEREHAPHNLPLSLLGASLLWVGWFGMTGGSAFTPDGVAAAAVFNTALAAAAGLLAWIGLERITFGKATTLGAASGLVVGLVAITPAAGYVAPWSAALIALTAGVVCHVAVGLKMRLRLDDSLDVAAVHLVGGMVGTLSVGLFASQSINPRGPQGLVFGGGIRLLGEQALATATVVGYSFALTLLLGWFVNRVLRSRVRPVGEAIGLDVAQHGETAYHLVSESPLDASTGPRTGQVTQKTPPLPAPAEHVGASAASATR